MLKFCVAAGSMVDTFTASGTMGYSLEGGGGDDILSGTDAAVMWDVAGTSVALGTAVFMLTSVELLQGGSMADMFMVSAASSYNIMGGGGADTFTINAALTGNIDGGDGGDTFSLVAAVTGALSGGAGVDTFNLNAGGMGMVSGMVDGNAGADILSYAARSTMVTVEVNTGATTDGFAGTATDTGGFADISEIRAGSATNDRFTGSDGTLTGTVYTVGANALNILNFEAFSTPMVGGGDVATTWIVTGNMVTEQPQGGTERVLMDVTTIQGGGMVDTVMVTGDTISTSVLTINGGGGNDVFTLDATLYGQINGGAGDDSFTFNGGGGVMSVAGASGGVDGGAGADIFAFNGGTIAGALVAGGDSDTLDFAGIANALMLALSGTPDSAGFGGSVSGGAVVSFTGIDVITGGSGTDSVQGLDAAGAWVLGASDSYASNGQTLMFSALENMQGGTMVDMFTVDGAHTGNIVGGSGADTFTLSAGLTGMLAGNEGDDVFNVNSGSSVSAGVSGDAGSDTFAFNGGTVSGTLAGGADSDTLDFAGIANALMLALSGTPDGAGFGGSISGGTVLAFSGINVITGGSGTDTIQGLDTANTWTLGAADSYASGSQTLMFSALENLQGGSMVDSFTVSDTHSGMAAGGAGDDGFVLSGSGLFTAGIDGEAGTDTVNGRNMDAIWTISGAAGSGMVVSGALTQAFAAVENLNGGSMADTFDFNGGTVTGTVAGGGDGDTLDFADISTALAVTLTGTHVTDGFGGRVSGGAAVSSFSGIDTIVGSTATTTDTLQGLNDDAMWTLSGSDSYSVNAGAQTLMFSSLEDLLGGSNMDMFTVGMGGHEGNIDGGGGNDEFTLSAAVTGMLAGGDGDDVFNLNSGSSVSAGINGGDGGDNFVFNGGMVSGEVAGGTGDDILDFSALATAVMVSLSGSPDVIGYAGYVSGATVLGNSATSTNGFTGINRIIGSRTDDVMDAFSGFNEASTFTLAADGGGTAADVYSIRDNPYNLKLDSIESYIGGSAADSYVINREYTG
ncbi:MAG: beta strand repeat-containing protein, partial [Candidatus Porifericomitaceae bacterium WSBS_2022_MAG_OTU9]